MADQGKPQGILTTGPSQNPTIKVVAIISDALDLQDKKVICKAICYCEVNPNKGKKKETINERNQLVFSLEGGTTSSSYPILI